MRAALMFLSVVALLGVLHRSIARGTHRWIVTALSGGVVMLFALELWWLPEWFDLPSSSFPLLATAALALLLGGAYTLLVPWLMGVASLGAWLWSWALFDRGQWWEGAFTIFEPLAVLGTLVLALGPAPRRAPRFGRWSRGLGAAALALAMVVLALRPEASIFTMRLDVRLTWLYRWLAVAAASGLLGWGVRRSLPELVQGGAFILLAVFGAAPLAKGLVDLMPPFGVWGSAGALVGVGMVATHLLTRHLMSRRHAVVM